jgi:hypothetical protein
MMFEANEAAGQKSAGCTLGQDFARLSGAQQQHAENMAGAIVSGSSRHLRIPIQIVALQMR